MKRIINLIAAAAISLSLLPGQAFASELLIPVGRVVGLELSDDTVTVAAFDDASGSAAKDAGLRIGDEILTIDETTIDSTEDVRRALERCDGDIDLCIARDGKQHRFTLIPQSTEDGPRLGIYLRQGIAGIGTVTWYDPQTNRFGTLGHGVSEADGGLLDMTQGSAFPARVLSVKKGKCGEPGQLRGSAEVNCPCGPLLKNTPQGVFGTCHKGWDGVALPTADYEEVKPGPAAIRSTVCSKGVQEYSVEIIKIYPKDKSDNRNFLLRVTDPQLLAQTGGIVQGMSGSPIIQDGKLVGAVTHVLVNDPKTGYGIFIENMLDAAA